MKYSGLLFILILTTATFGYSDDDKSVTNAMLLEKMELYQRLNDTRFELIFNELKKLREDMNDRFELMREEMNTRFEQVDKRIEQVDKRIDFNQQLILFLLALTVATPIGIEVWRKKLKKKNEEKLQKDFDALAAIIVEFSRLDERIRSAIRTVKEQGIILPNNLSYA